MAKFQLSLEDLENLKSKRRKNKFGAKPTTIDGIRFSSKKEGDWYRNLQHRQNIGEIKCFLRQVPFHLPGGIRYVIDFMIINNDDTVEFIECKGYMTQVASIKIKQASDIYKVKINVV